MKHYFNINAKAILDYGIKGLSFDHLALYEYCKDAINWNGSSPMIDGGKVWKWVSYNMILTNIPLFTCSEKTIYRMLTKLCEVGLLERCEKNKTVGKVFIAIGEVGLHIERELSGQMTRTDLSLTSDKNVLRPRTNLSDLYYNRDIVESSIKGKETRAQEIKIEQVNSPIEQPKYNVENNNDSIAESRQNFDPKICKGHGIEIKSSDFPKMKNGKPFPHPDSKPRPDFDLWWQLYDVNQSRGQCEGNFRAEKWSEIYKHTFLMVAVTEQAFRLKPVNYLRQNAYKDDILDRRRKEAPPATYGSTNGYQQPKTTTSMNQLFIPD